MAIDSENYCFDENLVNLLLSLENAAKLFSPTLHKKSNHVEKLLIRLGYSIELIDASAAILKEYSQDNTLTEILIEYSKSFNSLYQNLANLNYENWADIVEAKIKDLNRMYYDLISE